MHSNHMIRSIKYIGSVLKISNVLKNFVSVLRQVNPDRKIVLASSLISCYRYTFVNLFSYNDLPSRLVARRFQVIRFDSLCTARSTIILSLWLVILKKLLIGPLFACRVSQNLDVCKAGLIHGSDQILFEHRKTM